jgi:hypothetical protein
VFVDPNIAFPIDFPEGIKVELQGGNKDCQHIALQNVEFQRLLLTCRTKDWKRLCRKYCGRVSDSSRFRSDPMMKASPAGVHCKLTREMKRSRENVCERALTQKIRVPNVGYDESRTDKEYEEHKRERNQES